MIQLIYSKFQLIMLLMLLDNKSTKPCTSMDSEH